MNQDAVMTILKASTEPMTVIDIIEAHGVRENWRVADIESANRALRHLELFCLVRRVGKVPCKGGHHILWEATA